MIPLAEAAGSKGLTLLLWAAAILFLIWNLARRRRRASLGVTLEEARAELRRLDLEGRRDARTEAHLGAFLSWCIAYAFLITFSFSLTGFLDYPPSTEDRRVPLDRGTARIFALLTAAEGAGLWAAARGIARGDDRARWAAVGTATLLGLTAIAVGFFWSGPQAGSIRISNLILHAAAGFYAVIGATFLLLPRCERLCTADYREGAQGVDGPPVQAAINLARTKSPFSWLPMAVMAATVVVHEVWKLKGV